MWINLNGPYNGYQESENSEYCRYWPCKGDKGSFGAKKGSAKSWWGWHNGVWTHCWQELLQMVNLRGIVWLQKGWSSNPCGQVLGVRAVTTVIFQTFYCELGRQFVLCPARPSPSTLPSVDAFRSDFSRMPSLRSPVVPRATNLPVPSRSTVLVATWSGGIFFIASEIFGSFDSDILLILK